MYVKFTAHKPAQSGMSSRAIFDYLDKENQAQRDRDIQEWRNGDVSEERREELLQNFYNYDNLFNQDFDLNNLDDKKNHISVETAFRMIDENKGTRNSKEANFYMLNVSPSAKELQHLEKQAEEILAERGLNKDEVINNGNKDMLDYYQDQKQQILNAQLKSYAQDIMNEYAHQMDREIYANQDKLPSDKERREMLPEVERRYNEYLQEAGVKISTQENEAPLYHNLEYRKVTELDKGAVFSIYDSSRDANYNLYVPKEKYELEAGTQRVSVLEEYFSDKYSDIVKGAEYNNQIISVSDNATVDYSKERFKDYSCDDKVVINYNYKEFDKELKLYFSKNECDFVNGNYQVKEKVFNDKVYQAKTTFLNKQFSDERQRIFDEKAKELGYNFTKVTDENGKQTYLDPDKVPKGAELKKFNTEISIEFNKYLVEKKYLPAREKFQITDWNTQQYNVTFLMQTEKAVLTRIEDNRLNEPLQVWMPKFAIKSDIDVSDPPKESQANIIGQLYENKINERLELQNSKVLEFDNYSEITSVKERSVNKESVIFNYQIEGLEKPLSFHIEREKLDFSEGQYTMSRIEFETRYKAHLFDHCKEEFKSDYDRIQASVAERLSGEQQSKIEREADKEFKNFLIEKNIYPPDERDDRFKVQGEIDKANENSSLLTIKPEGYNEEFKLWVNNRDFSKGEKGEIFFKDKEQAQNLIDKAIERDKEQKQQVHIKYDSFTVEEIQLKEGEPYDRMCVFERREEGLKDPIKFTFKESELQRNGNEVTVPKYKLDYRVQGAKEKAILAEHGEVKNKIKEQVWQEHGFDTTKRKLEGKDLMWFGKIETERSYSYKDKQVLENRETMKQINELKAQPKPDTNKIKELESQLHRDKYSGEIIKEGLKKQGNQTHIHIVVSRHDKTSVNPKDKVSMSPMSNQKDSQMNNGAKVGFNRDSYFQRTEEIFDKKFSYDRPLEQTYQYHKGQVKEQSLGDQVQGYAKGRAQSEVKQFLEKHTGIAEAKRELDPIKEFKKEFSNIPLPTSIPKTKFEAVKSMVNTVKKIMGQTSEQGMGY
ncbi:DUF5712 family protein [Capnocytophaga sp. oral taxon 878]|uniref:DUF5712 family protein n=1 Tax=Capnocytophaga sp. oral taxon 878 TaxID=1316596 RepID=UPI000D0454BB|nr:DUF5712 family protein [Capnocytophaga sp. oral taxon 878]AVM51544.1 hypothetical protein C4H12_13580 [Capnocytophaga sp. oral taxon 878]